MKVAIANDHRGTESKEQIRSIVEQMGHESVDLGKSNDSPSDYPDVAFAAASAVSSGTVDRAILVCGTGIGMCIAANKVNGVRAALCYDELNAQISRQHNDANVLCLSGDLLGGPTLRKIVEKWLSTDFAGGRHQRRVNKIAAIEKGLDPREVLQ